MNRELNGVRAIVTGASSGIGRAIAVALANAGTRVIAAARSEEKLNALAAEKRDAGREITAVPCDVTSPTDRDRLMNSALRRLSGLDLLVNAAGIGSWGHFATSTEEINRRILEVNFFAPLELMRLAVPYLANGRKPAIVNVASMCGRRGIPAWPEYSASKFALVGASEAFRGEFARFGIDVITIVPGLTRTGLNSNLLRSEGRAKLPFDEGMEPDTVALEVLKGIRKNRREVVLGSEAKKILFLNRFAPRLLNRLIARRVTRLYEQSGE